MKKNIWIDTICVECGRYTPDDYKTIEDEIVARITKGKKPAEKDKSPHAVCLIGLPNCFDCEIGLRAVEYSGGNRSNYVDIVDQEALIEKTRLINDVRNIKDIYGKPTNYSYAYGWHNCISGGNHINIIARLVASRYNVIVTVHNNDLLIQLQSRGYVCSLVYVSVSMKTCMRRNREYATSGGRIIPPNASESNVWGWKSWIDICNVKLLDVPLLSQLADNFCAVPYDKDGRYPKKSDYVFYETHLPESRNHSWENIVAGIKKIMHDVDKNRESQ